MANRMVWNGTAYFGAGAVGSIPDEVARRGFTKALVVTDKDLIKFGVAQKVFCVLDKAGLKYEVFDGLNVVRQITRPRVRQIISC